MYMDMITTVLGFLLLVWMGFSAYAVLSVFLTRPQPGAGHVLGKIIWWYGVAVLVAATIVAAAVLIRVLGILVQALFGDLGV